MKGLSHHELTTLFFALAALLGSARLLGEIATRLRQPAILGEILAGILLGPTVLGAVAPGWSEALFPTEGNFPVALHGLVTVSIALFLLVAGLEVDLSAVLRQGKAAFHVGFTGMILPFLAGFGLAWWFPRLAGAEEGSDRLIFALFLATAMSISALPVIVKTLIDLNLFRSDLGMIIVASAVLHDLVGWNIFAVILGMMNGAEGIGEVGATIALTLLFVGTMLTAGRWLIDRMLPWIQAHTSWPGGVLGFALTGGLLCAALTEMIGIHAIFGAFIFGVALGDSSHLRAHTRTILAHFISFIFAPIFFASIGLQVNFVTHFDLPLVLLVLAIGSIGMVAGCTMGARMAGIGRRESLAIGFAMNARGAMEIILGLLAFQAGLIGERLFVALVIMALFTSLTSGSIMQALLRRKRPARIHDYLTGKRFTAGLRAVDRREAIAELAQMACAGSELDADAAFEVAWNREQVMSTSIDDGIAVPHARITGLKTPLVALGLSARGIDFDAKDGKPARVIFLIITPRGEHRRQLELLADIGQSFRDPEFVERLSRVTNYTEFLSLLKSHQGESGHNGIVAKA